MGELITERIARNARELKLLGLAETADELVERAEQPKLGYREFLDLVLETEVGVLEGRRYASRLKLSGLPHHKTLDEFDVSFQPELDPKRLAELRSLRFIEQRVCALILGPARRRQERISPSAWRWTPSEPATWCATPPSTISSAISAPLTRPAACARSSRNPAPARSICRRGGLSGLEPADANRFFQLINRRYTRSSTIVTSNKRVV